LNTQSDIALPKTKQHIRNNHGMQRFDQDVLFRPVDPPKDDGHIGGAAAEESHGEGEKFLV